MDGSSLGSQHIYVNLHQNNCFRKGRFPPWSIPGRGRAGDAAVEGWVSGSDAWWAPTHKPHQNHRPKALPRVVLEFSSVGIFQKCLSAVLCHLLEDGAA